MSLLPSLSSPLGTMLTFDNDCDNKSELEKWESYRNFSKFIDQGVVGNCILFLKLLSIHKFENIPERIMVTGKELIAHISRTKMMKM